MVVSGLSAGSRATAEAEVLIRQAQERARRRRRRIAAVTAVAATLLVAAFAALVAEGLVPSPQPAAERTGTAAWGSYRGTIEGVIEGCYGANPGPVPFPTIGGIVTLLTGPPPATSARGVIPRPMGGAVVAIERIRTGEKFSFREPVGRYVVSALAGDRESGFSRQPPVAVSLRPGATVRVMTAYRVCS